MNDRTSIIIPTYNHFHDAFKPCIDAVLQYTDLTNKEIIVVANGCTDETRSYLEKLADRVSYIWFDEPVGYINAVNAGIEKSTGEYVILLDNDSILMPQYVDEWVSILKLPFVNNPTVGASSPFAHEYENMGFVLHSGCTMYRTKLLKHIGMFDIAYHPGYFSDADVSMRIWNSGYKCVEVPKRDDNKPYNNNVFAINFPVMHLGTVRTMDKNKDAAILNKNRELLYSKYGNNTLSVDNFAKNVKPKYSIIVPTYNHCDDLLKPCLESIIQHTDMEQVELIVVANGCTDNTRDYLNSLGEQVITVWSDEALGYTKATNQGIKVAAGDVIILVNNDVVFLNQPKNSWLTRLVNPLTSPTVGLTGILENYDAYANAKFPIFFCVAIKRELIDKIGILDEIFSPGYGEDIDFTIRAIRAGYTYEMVTTVEFIDGQNICDFPIWHKNNQTFKHDNTYVNTVMRNSQILKERYNTPMKPKYSIVIPTYNHCDDLLKPCLESIEQYSDMSQIEVIVSANGCTDNTREYMESLDPRIYKLVWSDEALGYTKATNLGIKASTGEYVVLLNNDTLILPSERNTWLNMLERPFIEKSNVGLTGPLELFDDYANSPALIFFCVMVKRELFDKIGLLDEIFTPGGGEDIDFSVRAKLAGYEAVQVIKSVYNGSTNVGEFPIWHKDNKTFGDIPEYGNYIVKRNGLINAKRFNKSIKLNLGSGGVPYKGWLSVDLYDKRAHVKMDITKLDFDDNTVEEILASHVFEHLNPYHSLSILQDWLRVLKPGGKLAMEMPDIEATCAAFASASTGERYGLLNVIYGSVNTNGVGGDDNITSPHLFGWWKQSLQDHLANAGYTDIEFMDEQIPHPGSNLRVEAFKPLPNRAALLESDPEIYHEVFSTNGYNLTNSGPLSCRGKTVVDIGANVGMFTLRCVELGARRIIAVEPQPNVFNDRLLPNVQSYPQVTPVNRACLAEDDRTVMISNQHAHSVVGNSGDIVNTITLKTIVDRFNVEPDSYLKLDCEGSEYDIIMNVDPETLRTFKVIDMELHMQTNSNLQYRGFNGIMGKLDQMGFKMEKYVPHYMMYANGNMYPIDVCVMKWVRID